jgi:hypothetical protein
MTDSAPSTLPDPETAARAMRARKHRFLLTVAGNVLMLVVLVGGPYLRGLLRTRALWPQFAAASACMFGGTVRKEPGLGVPRGHEERFAAQVLHAPEGLKQRCDRALAKLSPDEAIFLLPWLKTAEYELREAVRVLREELAKVPPAGENARISTRPLRAFEIVRAALSRHALAAGLGTPPAALAFTFDQPATLQKPTRVPLYVGGDAVLSLWGNDRRVEALGIDGTGLSYLSMEAGTLWPLRLARPKLLSAFLPDSQGGVFVWAMPEARCRDRSDGCVGKTLGLARVRFPVSQLPEPRWFASHPAGRADRSVFELADGWLVAAAAAGGAVQLREFAALESSAGSQALELPPLAPRSHYALDVRGPVLIARLKGTPLVLHTQATTEATTLARVSATGETRELARVSGAGRSWLTSCSEGERVLFAFGHDAALRVGLIDAAHQVTTWPELALKTHAVVHGSDPARDRVQLLCGAKALTAFVHTFDGKLLSVTCTGQGERCDSHPLAQNVRGFAMALTAASALVAYAGTGEHAQIRLQRLDASGRPAGPALSPGACWSDARGMCGQPLLARLGARIVLGAREGTDLLALESPDEGTTWEPLRGIRKQE